MEPGEGDTGPKIQAQASEAGKESQQSRQSREFSGLGKGKRLFLFSYLLFSVTFLLLSHYTLHFTS